MPVSPLRLLVAGIAGALIVGIAVPAAAATGSARAPAPTRVSTQTTHPNRVLIISVPTLTWADLQDSGAGARPPICRSCSRHRR